MPAPRRDTILDAMRSLAILLMAMSHVARLVEDDARPLWGALSLLVEPYTQALFLGLVGASLVHSRQAAVRRGDPAGAWAGARLKRMLQLFLLSGVVFFLERERRRAGWRGGGDRLLAHACRQRHACCHNQNEYNYDWGVTFER